jgi:hypothetical protein
MDQKQANHPILMVIWFKKKTIIVVIVKRRDVKGLNCKKKIQRVK